MSREFTCASCGETFTQNWSEEEAEAELAITFPGYDKHECAIVCDECYKEMGFGQQHP